MFSISLRRIEISFHRSRLPVGSNGGLFSRVRTLHELLLQGRPWNGADRTSRTIASLCEVLPSPISISHLPSPISRNPAVLYIEYRIQYTHESCGESATSAASELPLDVWNTYVLSKILRNSPSFTPGNLEHHVCRQYITQPSSSHLFPC
jgi:hypothetical protein